MIVDTHIHLYDPKFGNYAWPPTGSKYHRLFDMDCFEQAHQGCVDAAVVIGCSSEIQLNRTLLDVCLEDTRVGAYIAQLDVSDAALCSNVKSFAPYHKFRGFRFVNRQGLKPDAQERIAEAGNGYIVEILGDWHDTVKFAPFCAAHPEIKFVVEHLVGYLFDGKPIPLEYRQFLSEMSVVRNVYMKLSGILTLARVTPKPQDIGFYHAVLEAAVDAFGVDRCLFGSDWPVLDEPYHASVAITKNFCDSLSPDAEMAILGKNAQELYMTRGML